MRDSERYESQAREVLRMAARARSPAEKEVYTTIAEGWKKLAAEGARNEARAAPRAAPPRAQQLRLPSRRLRPYPGGMIRHAKPADHAAIAKLTEDAFEGPDE